MNLTEFLLARISEDEEIARISYGVRWEFMHWPNGSQVLVHRAEIRDDKHLLGHLGHVASVEHGHDAVHMAHWNPARVLAECQAKRRIVEQVSGMVYVLRLLALPYADHPDYDETWRP